MDTTTTSSNRIHPLVATAAVAVTLVSLVGVAAITGLLPTSRGSTAQEQAPSAAARVSPYSLASGNATTTPLAQQQLPQPTASAAIPSNTHTAAAMPPAVRPASISQVQNHASTAPVRCASCGEVEAVRAVQHASDTSGLGIAAGAVLGGVLGNQVGGGNGRTLATVAGVLGGGYAGNEVEKRTNTTTTYMVDVRMENGKVRSFPQTADGWRVGDQVRVINGRLTARS